MAASSSSIGTYDPQLADDNKRVDAAHRARQHWLSVGAQPTDRVLRFLDAAGLLKRAPRNNPERAVPGKKATERAEARPRPRPTRPPRRRLAPKPPKRPAAE